MIFKIILTGKLFLIAFIISYANLSPYFVLVNVILHI